MNPILRCPCEPAVPCAQFGGRILDATQLSHCNGEGITVEEQHAFLVQMAHSRLPGLLTRVGSFAKSALAHTLDGFSQVDEATYAQRRAACNECPFRDAARDACTKCGCPLEGALLNKLRMASETCPMGKW